GRSQVKTGEDQCILSTPRVDRRFTLLHQGIVHRFKLRKLSISLVYNQLFFVEHAEWCQIAWYTDSLAN
ncbi:hypothetical protein, partial [Paenibacillus alginolyticus]|uniref:hypothetical protein n=1 Tax=Paenibacillus alginolyticus TaxID=59839 RepID=UPI001C273C68